MMMSGVRFLQTFVLGCLLVAIHGCGGGASQEELADAAADDVQNRGADHLERRGGRQLDDTAGEIGKGGDGDSWLTDLADVAPLPEVLVADETSQPTDVVELADLPGGELVDAGGVADLAGDAGLEVEPAEDLVVADEVGELPCEPVCDGAECGEDGCGGSCGECMFFEECQQGACVGPEGWWSDLVPPEWTPEFTDDEGRFVHDFSYAGYHNSEAPIPLLEEAELFDVTLYGADAVGGEDATAAFQAAIDAAAAAGGGIVFLPAGLYKCDGLLTVSGSHLVVRGAGPDQTKVYFTRHSEMTGKSHLSFVGAVGTVVELPLVEDGVARSRDLFVADASDLVPGDDVSLGWVITDEFIEAHGMTGTWAAFNGAWQTFFRGQVAEVYVDETPNRVMLDVPLRYPALMSDSASLKKEVGYLAEVGLEHLSLSNAVGWDEAWANERTHAAQFSGVKDSWILNVASFESPLSPSDGNGAQAHLQNGGLKVHGSKRVTVQDCVLEKAQNRGGGGCGYLFEIRMSNEIMTRGCTAREGRHNFIQNWGFGVTGCVWFDCLSEQGFAISLKDLPFIGQTGYSEFHHSLATANLMDSCVFVDGWKAVNRQDWSTGAGHTATENVFWNVKGPSHVFSKQFGWGYVIGTSPSTNVTTTVGGGWFNQEGEGTEPEDWVEGEGEGSTLYPQSLFEHQFVLRTGE